MYKVLKSLKAAIRFSLKHSMGEQTIQILNVTRQELVDIIKEGVKLELNRQRSMGNPLNRLTISDEDTKYIT